ncbi:MULTISPECIES: membrane integrity-associated transporter subunit PqiC [Pseudomonas]|jgi:hypothetical protein|uniref:PqiC family protein n=1 Tax=Pseudomonas monsensis TaxID=2745509 RepID=A0ABT3YNG7_9PSED|nr:MULTISPECIES: PqiC family protein [Pseudomonas]MCY0106725.1 PqiC family protein [Pseudomonas monsensis]PTS97029.1 hypothetical protein DBR24_17775 [Pseudomonas sp. HMWF006]QXH97968.1 PqiC family protein [Pseudomonas monsensis]RON61856.1 hypothetical protein BK669_20500 [Pseudomonas fluorescens]
MAAPLKITVLAACLLLGACRSDPISFHTLTPVQLPNTRAGAQIPIEGITVPPQVDRPQIVIRQGNSGLAILETQWWGASLADELRSALSDQLSNTGSHGNVSVRIDVQRFDSIPGQYGLIDVKWRLRPSGAADNSLLTCRSTLQTPSGPGIDDLVVAQQNNVRRLAALISQAAGNSRACPPVS